MRTRLPAPRAALAGLLALGAASAALAFVLLAPTAAAAGLWLRWGTGAVVAAFALVVFPAYLLERSWSRTARLALLFVLFGLPLAGLWGSGASEPNVLGGLLPWSDAHAYFSDATRLLGGHAFGAVSSRRPLFPGLLTALLGATGASLPLVLALLAAFLALAAFFLGEELLASFGPAGAALGLLVLFFFSRRFIGTTLTEALGLSLGALAASLLLSAARDGRGARFLAGLFFLGVALTARAGAFLVLPALVLFAARRFRVGRAFSPAWALGALAAAVLAFAPSAFLLERVGAAKSLPYGNFAPVFYALAKGGGDWTRAAAEHPEASEGEIYRLAFDAVRREPSALLGSFRRALSEFVTSRDTGVLGFLEIPGAPTGRRAVGTVVRFGLGAALLLGLFRALRRPRPEATLVFVASLGILASVPLLPPWDADRMRVYAATMPLLAALAASAVRPRATPSSFRFDARRAGGPIAAASSLLATLLVLGAAVLPLLFRGTRPYTEVFPAACGAGERGYGVAVGAGSFVSVRPDDALVRSRAPELRVSDFRRRLASLFHPEFAAELAGLEPPYTLVPAYRMVFLVVKGAPPPLGPLEVCESPPPPSVAPRSLLYAERVRPAPPVRRGRP